VGSFGEMDNLDIKQDRASMRCLVPTLIGLRGGIVNCILQLSHLPYFIPEIKFLNIVMVMWNIIHITSASPFTDDAGSDGMVCKHPQVF
jgi:hypothetical protein